MLTKPDVSIRKGPGPRMAASSGVPGQQQEHSSFGTGCLDPIDLITQLGEARPRELETRFQMSRFPIHFSLL